MDCCSAWTPALPPHRAAEPPALGSGPGRLAGAGQGTARTGLLAPPMRRTGRAAWDTAGPAGRAPGRPGVRRGSAVLPPGYLRADQPDRPAGHRARAGRPARRPRPAGPGRPVAGPRPGGPRAAGTPRPRWCVTVTDEHGHAIGHGCARPHPRPGKRRRTSRARARPADTTRPAATARPVTPRGPAVLLHRRRASMARRAATAPGGCPPASRGSGT